MLSYRHSFHAGNFADVIKHVILVEVLDYMTRKDKGLEYIDTHSGAGLFNLSSQDAVKLNEHQTGVNKLIRESSPVLAKYFKCIDAFNSSGQMIYYPGSPLIALEIMRTQDKARLYELHPRDVELLRKNVANDARVRVYNSDGLKGLLGLLPPITRRAVILIDPSYEVKNEYDLVFDAIVKAYRQFSTGVYMLWYPVVDRIRIERLEKRFKHSGIRNIQRFELAVRADEQGHGMTASGMFVINPPWTLFDSMKNILPVLTQQLTEQEDLTYKCDLIVAE